MRPVRFVALSEDGQALVLADEVGRLLALPLDDRVTTVVRGGDDAGPATPAVPDPSRSLAPRDIQARIRAGESADDVARVAGVPVDRVLRYAGPVLQERAMLAQHARRTRLRGSEKNQTLAEVVDGKLTQHGVDSDKISWDAYRRDDGTWRILASWPSGKATAQAVWELDKARQHVTAYDDMAQYLCTERPGPLRGQEPAAAGHAVPGRGEPGRGHGLPVAAEDRGTAAERPAAEPGRGRALPAALGEPPRRVDPIRSGRDALLASLDRPLAGEPAAAGLASRPANRPVSGGAAALLGGPGSAFDEDPDAPKEVPAVPSLAVLRPRRTAADAAESSSSKSRKRLPSWDDVLFGGAPARESS
ncbi:MAG TPA: septation protein SepH [Pilimelia sp.]|nr:septation protein SepH [Pilimelia sp.]